MVLLAAPHTKEAPKQSRCDVRKQPQQEAHAWTSRDKEEPFLHPGPEGSSFERVKSWSSSFVSGSLDLATHSCTRSTPTATMEAESIVYLVPYLLARARVYHC